MTASGSQPVGVGTRLRTGQHFRPGQLLAYGVDRLLRLAERASPLPVHELTRLVPGPRTPDRDALAGWGGRAEAIDLAPPWRPDLHGDPTAGQWCFQEEQASFDGPVDWAAPDRSLLWRFHLHYLDTPAALAAAQPDGPWQPWLTELLEDHWRRCRPGRSVGWTAFPVAVRLQNLLRVQALLEARGGASPELDRILCRHTRAAFHHLRCRQERHLQANHLLKELCVLCTGAVVWGGPRLLARYLAATQAQVALQFLAGGGHEERSLKYHLDCLRDLAELRAALPEPPAWIDATLRRGLAFAEALEHPDGDIPLLNDSELGAAPRRSELDRVLGITRPRWEGLRAFVEEGYFAARIGETHLVFDCAPIAGDHQPGHAHCDILSIEVSHGGRRVLGNRGTLAYGDGEPRRTSRTTASHSTVQFDDLEQVEIWGGFRVGWRSRPVLELAREDDDGVLLAGRYDWHPSTGARHRRTVRLTRDDRVVIVDEVTVGRTREPVGRFWLPGATLDASGSGFVGFRVGDAAYRLAVDGGVVRADRSTWFPRQGREEPALRVEVRPERGFGPTWRVTTELAPAPVS